ncbi:hypothetical protein G3570_05435 [Balneolaceae bacterium YR4-1]|uniref:Uncharacterized protein n=1 Tax=Halalkalibaculum roseum TaxID=2709311 RepID=A0A6M1STD3_9BACT|nr:hypothetical protein [Halalkalibaculum roseum]NGP76062.1 hypothetical protein [Halalkalibaculum roseum]
MAKDKIDRLEEKKKELKAELENIQHELDQSIDGVRSDMSSKLDPVEFIKKHPLEVVGASVLVGFLAGHSGREGRRHRSSSDDGISDTLLYELKRLATKKAISFAGDYLEKFLSDKKEEILTSENGSVKKD